MVSAFENNSFYNYSLLFVSEIDILPPEITESQKIITERQAGWMDSSSWTLPFPARIMCCYLERNCLTRVHVCNGWCTHTLDMMSLYIFV